MPGRNISVRAVRLGLPIRRVRMPGRTGGAGGRSRTMRTWMTLMAAVVLAGAARADEREPVKASSTGTERTDRTGNDPGGGADGNDAGGRRRSRHFRPLRVRPGYNGDKGVRHAGRGVEATRRGRGLPRRAVRADPRPGQAN